MIAALAVLAASATAGCTPVEGAERLWQPPIRWVIAGEMHGTNETPEAFANLVCLASATRRPVTVALEYPADEQSKIDRFLGSNGDARAQANLLQLRPFIAEMQDGRGSVAFMRLFDQLRLMKRARRITGVVAFDVARTAPAVSDRNAVMAQNWRTIPDRGNGIVLALVGNVHAVRKPLTLGSRTIIPAASLLPAERTVTLDMVGAGGAAWICLREGCGAREIGPVRTATAAITYSDDPQSRWAATYSLGKPTTAAFPARMHGGPAQ